MLEHVDQLLDDKHSIGVFNGESNQRTFCMFSSSWVVAAKEHHERSNTIRLGDCHTVELVPRQGIQSACRSFLRLGTFVSIK